MKTTPVVFVLVAVLSAAALSQPAPRPAHAGSASTAADDLADRYLGRDREQGFAACVDFITGAFYTTALANHGPDAVPVGISWTLRLMASLAFLAALVNWRLRQHPPAA